MTVNEAIIELERVRALWGGDLPVAVRMTVWTEKVDPVDGGFYQADSEYVGEMTRVSCEMDSARGDARRRVVLR